VHITRNDEQYLCSDASIFDDAGELVAEVIGMTCKRLVGAGSRQADTSYEGCYEYQWVPAPRDPQLHGRVFDCTRAVLVADAFGIAGELAKRFVAENIEPLIIPFEDAQRLDDLLAQVPLDRRTLIVFAAGLGVGGEGDSDWKGLSRCPLV